MIRTFLLFSFSTCYGLRNAKLCRHLRKFSLSAIPITLKCNTAEDIEILGSKFGFAAEKADVILLKGDLGAGKTCFSRGFIRAKLNDAEMVVTSPSYLLDNTYVDYDNDDLTIHHMDLYRLPTGCDMNMVGIPHIFYTSVCLIEWPQRMRDEVLPESYLSVDITIDDDGDGAQLQSRRVHISPVGPRWSADRLGHILA